MPIVLVLLKNFERLVSRFRAFFFLHSTERRPFCSYSLCHSGFLAGRSSGRSCRRPGARLIGAGMREVALGVRVYKVLVLWLVVLLLLLKVLETVEMLMIDQRVGGNAFVDILLTGVVVLQSTMHAAGAVVIVVAEAGAAGLAVPVAGRVEVGSQPAGRLLLLLLLLLPPPVQAAAAVVSCQPDGLLHGQVGRLLPQHDGVVHRHDPGLAEVGTAQAVSRRGVVLAAGGVVEH